MKTGNGIYLTYPDIRGEQEKYYLDLFSDAQPKPQQPANALEDDDWDKPHLSAFDNKLFLKVAAMAEDKETLRLMNDYHSGTENSQLWENERAMEDLQYLMQIKDENIPVEANADYRVALRLAVGRYRINKILAQLPAAYDRYTYMLSNEISLLSEADLQTFKIYQHIARQVIQMHEEGHKINGE